MTERQKHWLGYLILVVAILVAGYLGVNHPMPEPPEAVEALGTSHMSGPLDITDGGSASAPAFYLEGDSNTGLYQSAADNLDIAVAGARDFNFAANTLNVLSGSEIDVNSGATLDVNGTIDVDGTFTAADLSIDDDLTVGDDADVQGDLLANTLTVTGTSDLGGNVSSSTGAVTVTDSVNVTGAVDFDSTLNVDGASTLVGAVTAQNDLTVDDTFAIDDTSYTLTGTQTLVPTASYYVLNPGAVLTLTISTTGVLDGDFLWLVNISANNVTVVDTTATAGGGDRTLGQYDVIGFIYSATRWIEAFYSDNS